MEMPKVTDAHRKLQKLVGSWTGDERISPSPWDPKGGAAIGKVLNRGAVGGLVVVQDYTQERNGAVSFSGHGVLSWDGIGECYVMHWWDSMGMPPGEFRGQFQGDVLTLCNEDSQMHSRATFDLSKPGRYAFKMEVSQDGNQWYPFMEGSYTRQD